MAEVDKKNTAYDELKATMKADYESIRVARDELVAEVDKKNTAYDELKAELSTVKADYEGISKASTARLHNKVSAARCHPLLRLIRITMVTSTQTNIGHTATHRPLK